MQVSNCCYADLLGEPYKNAGRCGDCKEHCGVINQIEVTFIKSENTLGTVNGYDWTVYPQV